jgi:hypothetical protein
MMCARSPRRCSSRCLADGAGLRHLRPGR